MGNDVLQRPATAPDTQERPSVPPRGWSGTVIVCLFSTTLLAGYALFASRGTDTAKNWQPDDKFVQPTRIAQPTRRNPRPPSNDRVTQTTVKPKPPAPKGFHDFHLGLTRKEVHALVESWGTDLSPPHGAYSYDPYIYTRRYGEVESIILRFDDSDGLSTQREKAHPGNWFYVRSTDLTSEQARARLTFVSVKFRELEAKSPEELLKPLRERFGFPDLGGPAQAVQRFGVEQSPFWVPNGGIGPVRSKLLVGMWIWEDMDRAIISGLWFRESGTISLQLVFADGLLAQEAAQKALEEQRRNKEQQRIADAAETLRKGLSGNQKIPK
ncbi:MAG: hypothetical protein G01um101438_653 [Parcubacteria group bacterium Gr01-1014_38]|nr:MAG: hypothetical protein G01um101438_653 [Parcubacteria group bacterium Gr01-1014_38]